MKINTHGYQVLHNLKNSTKTQISERNSNLNGKTKPQQRLQLYKTYFDQTEIHLTQLLNKIIRIVSYEAN